MQEVKDDLAQKKRGTQLVYLRQGEDNETQVSNIGVGTAVTGGKLQWTCEKT